MLKFFLNNTVDIELSVYMCENISFAVEVNYTQCIRAI